MGRRGREIMLVSYGSKCRVLKRLHYFIVLGIESLESVFGKSRVPSGGRRGDPCRPQLAIPFRHWHHRTPAFVVILTLSHPVLSPLPPSFLRLSRSGFSRSREGKELGHCTETSVVSIMHPRSPGAYSTLGVPNFHAVDRSVAC